jgi:xanthine/CO dehydrogenase XdhC/CoxF family maturation factor
MSDLDPLDHLTRWSNDGRKCALATVVATWGSSPRPVGSHLAIAENGDFAGSVSGGCIEGAVVEAGLEAIKTGKPRLLEYGVTNETAWEVGLACGGRIEVFVEPLI